MQRSPKGVTYATAFRRTRLRPFSRCTESRAALLRSRPQPTRNRRGCPPTSVRSADSTATPTASMTPDRWSAGVARLVVITTRSCGRPPAGWWTLARSAAARATAYGINNAGQVVGGSDTASGGHRAFRVDGRRRDGRPRHPRRFRIACAYGINDGRAGSRLEHYGRWRYPRVPVDGRRRDGRPRHARWPIERCLQHQRAPGRWSARAQRPVATPCVPVDRGRRDGRPRHARWPIERCLQHQRRPGRWSARAQRPVATPTRSCGRQRPAWSTSAHYLAAGRQRASHQQCRAGGRVGAAGPAASTRSCGRRRRRRGSRHARRRR